VKLRGLETARKELMARQAGILLELLRALPNTLLQKSRGGVRLLLLKNFLYPHDTANDLAYGRWEDHDEFVFVQIRGLEEVTILRSASLTEAGSSMNRFRTDGFLSFVEACTQKMGTAA
jgi:hypothetical protein